MSLIGHNGGPTIAAGTGWQRHCWRKAREDLLPRLPLEVIRTRVRRAAEIGMDYRAYATVRATTGTDIVAFLYSSNALRLFREHQALEAARAEKLRAQVNVGQRLAAQPPLDPDAALAALAGQGIGFDAGHPAPSIALNFPALRRAIREMLPGLPSSGVMLVGDTGWERDWSVAGRLAGYLPAERFFGGA